MKSNILLLVACAAVVMSSSLMAQAQGTGLSKKDLQKLFENTDWVAGRDGTGTFHIIFQRDGKGVMGDSLGAFYYTVEAPDILKIYSEDPDGVHKGKEGARKTKPKPEFELYRVNVAAMLVEFDAASPKPGGKPMKYIGPAPKNLPKPKK